MNGHGVYCGCTACSDPNDFEDERLGKAYTRAAEVDDPDDCD